MLPKSKARQEYDKQAHDFEVEQIPEVDFEVEQEASQIPGAKGPGRSKARQAHDKLKVPKEEADKKKMETGWPGYGGGDAPPERKTRDGTFVNILTGFLILLFMTKILAWAIKTIYSMLRSGKKTATQNLPEE